jgi:hypothetical protein
VATFKFRIPDLNRDNNLTNDGNIVSNTGAIINWILTGLDLGTDPVVLHGKDENNNNNYIRKNQIHGEAITL